MTVLIILAMVASVLLVLIVLAQNAKGGGLSGFAGGSGASNLIGVKKTGDILERLTWALAITIMLLSLGTNLLDPSTGTDDILEKVKNERLQNRPSTDSNLPDLNATPADTTK
ncbi:MAG: preprotein translocase subunit SecG [Bacteroidota bacterium]